MEGRTRNNEIKVRLSDGELQLLKLKMDTVGIKNREAYIRKMA
ncbi:MAG TPA: plasmid mobilization relaxosome protein MobC, partial [Ruminococcaceae bacterium]|nr:plasmid mobilization relaxosome protein MobC [Oscillospiraceae bacterium]